MKERDLYIDWLKGLAIFLVVLGHCWLTDKVTFWFIYRFHMPLFFCISGYLFNNKKRFGDFLKSKVKTIIIPYTVFFVISYLVTIFFIRSVPGENVIKAFLLNGRFLGNVNNFALWYLPLFFIVSILFYFLTKARNKIIFISIIIICGILSVPMSSFFNNIHPDNYIPFSLQVVPAAMFYMGIGRLVKMNKGISSKVNFKVKAVFSVILLVVGIIMSIKNKDQIINVSTYNYIIAALLIIQFIVFITKENKNKIFAYLGKNSLIILGLHRVILELMHKYGVQELLGQYNINGIIAAILVSSCTIFVICLAHELYIIIRKMCKNILNKKLKHYNVRKI